MFPILMAVFFALFGISMLLKYSAQSAAAPVQALKDMGHPEAASPGDIPSRVTQVINERIAQLDEKLVDLHTRTASQLKASVDDAEERLRELEKDVSAKLADAAANAGSAAAPSTTDIPDIKHIMHERMEQFDSKLIDMHARVAKRLEETAKDVEEKLRMQAKDLSSTIPDMVLPAGGAPAAVDSAKLEKFMQERMEQFDEKIIDMHTRIAKRLEEAAEEQEKKIKGIGVAEGGGASEERIRELEEKIEFLAAQEPAPAGGGADAEVLARMSQLEEKVKLLAAAGPPAGGGAAVPSPGEMPNLDQLMQERMEQFDAKIIDMHTRIARRLEETAQEQEKKIKAIGGETPAGGGVPDGRIKELEEKVERLAAQGPPAAAAEAGDQTVPDLKALMKERMEQFDEKLIDMHTNVARRLQETAAEQEQKILTIGDEAGKTLSDRITALEEKVRLLVELVNEKG